MPKPSKALTSLLTRMIDRAEHPSNPTRPPSAANPQWIAAEPEVWAEAALFIQYGAALGKPTKKEV